MMAHLILNIFVINIKKLKIFFLKRILIALLIYIIKKKKFIFKIEKEKVKFTMEMKY